ncbi:MAG: imidazoleglycerol-phosphate dehydratase HisB [Methanobrevibacter sp.]|jgi:imidazoleglycerol-phosphate dehydratase|nr:imidazoleglycerol-phosphate dehydratase HisB [Methanobrevibacter sp.]
MVRKGKVVRKTSETDIKVEIDLDGSGNYKIDTGINFFNHMLESFSKHSFFDLKIKAIGDTEIDDHHTIEDVGMVLGESFSKALGDKKGIKRMAHAIVPMDDSLSTVAIDIGGRSYSNIDISFNSYKIGDMSSEVVPHFFESFASTAKININAKVEGNNDHHKVESLFKAFAKAMKEATTIEHDKIPSTKGVL